MSDSTPRQKPAIRKATKTDAVGILRAHHAAVRITAAKDYDKDTLEEWSDWSCDTDDRVARLEEQISNNPENTIMLVAEINGNIVGFGEVAPGIQELRAVYVSPGSGRNGIGRALLQELEAVARKQGVSRLWLDSSLTAESFYSSHGYLGDGRGEHQLRSGRKMPCVKMHKDLLE